MLLQRRLKRILRRSIRHHVIYTSPRVCIIFFFTDLENPKIAYNSSCKKNLNIWYLTF